MVFKQNKHGTREKTDFWVHMEVQTLKLVSKRVQSLKLRIFESVSSTRGKI